MDYETKIKEFYLLLGESLRYCQQIEHDVQVVLALMQEGDKRNNLECIKNERKTLGETIHALKDIDSVSPKPFFSQKCYRLLFSMTGERNHFVHQSFNEFQYRKGGAKEESFALEYNRLRTFHEDLRFVASVALHARLELARYTLKQ